MGMLYSGHLLSHLYQHRHYRTIQTGIPTVPGGGNGNGKLQNMKQCMEISFIRCRITVEIRGDLSFEPKTLHV
jgi:hypothetical protein